MFVFYMMLVRLATVVSLGSLQLQPPFTPVEFGPLMKDLEYFSQSCYWNVVGTKLNK